MAEENKKEKPHVSHTQLSMFWRCPEQYRRRYIEEEILLPGIALIQGRSIHKGAEYNFKQKIDSHEDVPEEDIVDVSISAFETEVAGGYELSMGEMRIGASTVIGQAKDVTVKLAHLHAQEQAPDYQPIAVEKKTRIELKTASHDLVGITDLTDDQNRVTDIKTAGKSMPQTAVDESTQLTIYAAAHLVEYSQLPAEVRFDNLVKTKTPKRQVLQSTRTMMDIQVLSNRINVTLAAINAGLFPPCPAGSWQCSSKWCGYWTSCPYVNSERKALNS